MADLGIETVDFIKIDTEGWELNVLRGAERTLQRDHPIILMEFNETNIKQCNIRVEDILAFLSTHGYVWELFGSEDILCTPVNMK